MEQELERGSSAEGDAADGCAPVCGDEPRPEAEAGQEAAAQDDAQEEAAEEEHSVPPAQSVGDLLSPVSPGQSGFHAAPTLPALPRAREGQAVPRLQRELAPTISLDGVHVVPDDDSDSEGQSGGLFLPTHVSPHRSVLGLDASLSVLDVSTLTRGAQGFVRTKRPFDEVVASVEAFLDLRRAPPQQRRRIRDFLRDVMNGDAVCRELGVFYSHLQALLGTVLAQVADYLDTVEGGRQPRSNQSSAAALNVTAETEECSVLGGIVCPSVMSDVVSAARLSLREYHTHCVPLRKRCGEDSPASHPRRRPRLLRTHSPSSGSASPASRSPRSGCSPRQGRRLSSVMPDSAMSSRSKSLTVAGSFVQALTEGSLMGAPEVTPKRRPSHRVDRGEPSESAEPDAPAQRSLSHANSSGGQSALTQSRCSIRLPEHVDPAPGNRLSLASAGSAAEGLETAGVRSSIPSAHGIDLASPDCVSVSGSEVPPGCRSPSTCITRHLSQSATQVDLERRLAGLTTLQYFDIIVETLGCLLCVKYERQILALTCEGEDSGARRMAEWITARIVDEMFHDGIDPSVPLDLQLLHCTEGIAMEEGVYHWRTHAQVDAAVSTAVWGMRLPEDVRDGVLACKDRQRTWYEWGVLTKPGIVTAAAAQYTGARLNALEYNYRLAPVEMAEALGLRKVHDVLRAPSFLKARPGLQLLDSRSAQTLGVPGLTLSVPPEGSEHKGGSKQKPHIRPRNPDARREFERRHKRRHKRSRQEMVAVSQAAAELQRAGTDASDASDADSEFTDVDMGHDVPHTDCGQRPAQGSEEQALHPRRAKVKRGCAPACCAVA